jgi:flagellar basal body-associated protein FliL
MTPWDVIRQHIEVSSNRGILLLLLLFALACSFLVAVFTFLRWIVYKIQNKSKGLNQSQVTSTGQNAERMRIKSSLPLPPNFYETRDFQFFSGMELHKDRGEGPRRRRVGALRKPSVDERRMFRLESGRRTN